VPAVTGLLQTPSLHVSRVHTLPSGVHATPSVLGANTQPEAGLHESLVHSSLSLQVMVEPMQLPAEQ
jgi:hypothetical protein